MLTVRGEEGRVGYVCDGVFKEDQYDPRGLLRFANGDVYVGDFDFSRHCAHGRGLFKYSNGDVSE